ncbi:GH13862 [Drosophila grimshawi]|uniref:GH13862 n=1 Tax=Drosophila grimshawi TaxID=7222 RepID=B4JP39_DROGR|nr:GH13862 [Drosophila grimshawi]
MASLGYIQADPSGVIAGDEENANTKTPFSAQEAVLKARQATDNWRQKAVSQERRRRVSQMVSIVHQWQQDDAGEHPAVSIQLKSKIKCQATAELNPQQQCAQAGLGKYQDQTTYRLVWAEWLVV